MGARKIADFKVKGITTMNAMVRWMIASLGILVFGFARGEVEVVNINGTNYYNRAAMTHSKVNEMRMYDATIPVKLCNEKATGQAPGYPMRGSAKNCCEHITRATFEKLGSGEMEIRITVALPGLNKVDGTTVYWDHNLISEKGKYSEHVRVWIDWNGDKKWSSSECVLTDSQKDYKALSNCKTLNFKKRVNIPSNSVPETYARVILSWGENISDPAAKSWMWGDVVDELVYPAIYKPSIESIVCEGTGMSLLGTIKIPKIAISEDDVYFGLVVLMSKDEYKNKKWTGFATGAGFSTKNFKELSKSDYDNNRVRIVYELMGQFPKGTRQCKSLTFYFHPQSNYTTKDVITKEVDSIPVYFHKYGSKFVTMPNFTPNWVRYWPKDYSGVINFGNVRYDANDTTTAGYFNPSKSLSHVYLTRYAACPTSDEGRRTVYNSNDSSIRKTIKFETHIQGVHSTILHENKHRTIWGNWKNKGTDTDGDGLPNDEENNNTELTEYKFDPTKADTFNLKKVWPRSNYDEYGDQELLCRMEEYKVGGVAVYKNRDWAYPGLQSGGNIEEAPPIAFRINSNPAAEIDVITNIVNKQYIKEVIVAETRVNSKIQNLGLRVTANSSTFTNSCLYYLRADVVHDDSEIIEKTTVPIRISNESEHAFEIVIEGTDVACCNISDTLRLRVKILEGNGRDANIIDQYEIQNISYSGGDTFVSPSLRLLSVTDEIVGTNLQLNCTVFFSEVNPVAYKFTGQLWSEDETNLIANVETDSILHYGTNTVVLNISGVDLYKSKIDGKSVLKEFQAQKEKGDQIFEFEEYALSTNCTYYDFLPINQELMLIPGSVQCDLFGFDVANRDKSIKVDCIIANRYPSPDLYELSGSLASDSGHIVSVYRQNVQLPLATNNISIYFSGADIRNSGYDGPYKILEICLRDKNGKFEIDKMIPNMWTEKYNCNQFSPVPFTIISSNITSQVSLKNGKYKSLDVLIPLTIATEGEITIDATLVDANGNFVASASLTEYRNAGDAIFALPFQGGDIFASGINGPYRVVNLSVSHSSEPDYTYDEEKTSMITEAYKYDDFVSHSEMYGGIPTEGLVYQLDASNISSITTNANGEVLEWFSTDGLIRFATDENSDIRPCYIDDAIGGRGAILFGSNTVSKVVGSSRMVTTTDTDNQTVFIVTKPISSQNSYAGVWGSDGFSMGFSAGSTSWFTYSFPSTGALYKNGIRAKENPPLDIGRLQILTAVSGSIQDFTTAIGNFFNSTNYPSRYYKGAIGEIIVYNRELSDAERLHVELHLQKKWITGKDGLFVSTPDRFLMSNAQNAEMEIVALSDWKVTTDSNWLTMKEAEGTNIASVAYSVDENLTGTNRVARIIVSNTETSICHTVTQYFQDFYKKGIEFEKPVTISHASDVRTDGELIAAYCVSYPRNVNGVSFSPSRGTTFSGVSWYGGTYSASAAPWSSLSSNYRYILTGAFGGSKVTLNGLEIGRHYLVQLWSNNSTENGVGDTMIVDGGRGSRTLVQNSTGAVGGVGQYVVGYFVADASHIDIALSGDDVINAIQLRKIEALPQSRISIIDSIRPYKDEVVSFGEVLTGLSKKARITVSNSHSSANLMLKDIRTRYVEDFSSGNLEYWAPNIPADWTVENGAYKAANGSATKMMVSSYSGGEYSDVAVQTECWRTGSMSSSAGIVLRASESYTPETGNGYMFLVSGNAYSVWRVLGGVVSTLQGWTSTSLLEDGKNTLLANASGTYLSFHINGKKVWEGEDAAVSRGRVCLCGYTETTTPTIHYFDNVIIDSALPISSAVSMMDMVAHIIPENPWICPERPMVENLNENDDGLVSLENGVFELEGLPEFPYEMAPGESVSVEVTCSPQQVGSVMSAVTLLTNDEKEPVKTVELSAEGIPDYLVLSPNSGFHFERLKGKEFSPDKVNVSISNRAEVVNAWRLILPEWLDASLKRGELGAKECVDVVMSPNQTAYALAAGVYSGLAVLSNEVTSLTAARTVTLVVKESSSLELSDWDIEVTNKVGCIKAQNVIVSNAVDADVALNAVVTPLEIGRVIASEPSEAVAVSQSTTALAPGYSGTFRLPPGIEFRKQELLVKFDENAATAQAQEAKLAALGGGEVVRRYKLVPGLALIRIPVPVATTKEMEELVQRFEAATGISYVQPNYEQKALAIPNDPRFEELYAMRNVGQTGGTSGCDISTTLAWDRTTGNESVIVGVIDSGVDYNHEDLTANMWVNFGEVPGDGIDNDGNGVVDDVYGYNSIEDSGDPMDDNKHGTHCAGTIAAVGNNGIGVAGVCWTARIMALKFLDANGRGDTANALACIEYAVLNGAKILSNSWGGGAYSYALKEMIDAAGKQGVLFVAAAGNEGTNNDVTPHYPSSYSCENIIAVLSVDHNDRRASSSCYGLESVDIAAPGVNILSCYMGGGYVKLSGTSMATPHVSGAAALLLSVNQGMTPYQIKETLMNSGDPVAEGLCVSGKRLNVARALRSSGRWLSVSKERIENLEPGTQTDLGITFDAGWCEPGVYDGIVRFASNDQNKPVTNLTVRMVVEPDDLRVSPSTSFDVYGVEGGPFSPTSGVYRIRNASSVPVSWAVATSNSWISVSPSEGVIPGGGSQDVVVTVNEHELQDYPQGAYTAELFIENRNNGIVQRRFANLTIRNTAGVLYVDPNRPDDSGSGRSWRSAKKTLNSAIAKAMDGATIVVTNGVYSPIDTRGKTLTIRSVNGPLETVIDGRNQAQCAILGGSKYVSGYRVFDTNVVVSGFTLRNGHAERKLVNGVYEGGIYGGGAYGGVLTNCYLIGNRATYGAGSYGCKLYDCLVARNEASYAGGGLYLCDAINCRIEYNRAERGAGMYQGNAVGCLIEHNRSASYGGGVYSGSLLNCTVVDNKCKSYGGAGTYRSAMTNSIVWGNVRISDGATYNTDGGSAVRSCIQTPDSYYNAKTTLDSYSISSDPKFVDSDSGIYMLSSLSPCLNRGVVVDNLTSVDMLGRERVQDGAPDCGAYEGVPSGYVIAGAVDGVGLIDRRIALVESGGTARFAAIAIDRDFDSFLVDGSEVSRSTVYEWENVTSNGKIVARFRNTDIFVDANRPDDSGDGKTWMTAKRTLNGAVNAVYEGESIIVTNGIYTAVNTLGKKIVLRSVEGASKTIIDGGGTNRCANLTGTYVVTSGYGAGSTLMGFTLQNGYSTSTAGGAYYGTLVNCIVRGNKAETSGGGVYYSALTNCVIASNMANIGGGIYYGRAFNCSIVGNRANKSSSGVYGSYCRDSVIWGNRLRNCDTSDVQSGSFFNCYVENPSSMSSAIYTTDPGLVDPMNGDARLRVGSPCIDKGMLLSNFPLGEYDVVMKPRVCGARVDIGAYEGNAVDGYVISGSVSGHGELLCNTAIVSPGGSAVFTALPSKRKFLGFMTNGVFVATSNMTFEWNNITSDGAIKAVYEKVNLYVDAKRPDDTGSGTSWATAYKTLQAAVDEALDDETVYVAAGVYDSIEVDDKFILIKSVSGAADTVVDGGGKTRCAKLGKVTVHHSVIMDGFTFTNGFATQGAGVQYGTLTNCIIVANVASGSGYVHGGGTYYSDLYSCEVRDNVARGSDAYAGGCYYGTRVNCVIVGNTAETTTRWAYGGGVHYGTSIGCLIANNSIKASETSSLSCYGGGACYGTLRNCTVVGNSIPAGLTSAGVYNGSIYNSIVWENRTEANVLANHPGSSMSYSCSSPRPSGTSNINSNPLFIDAGNGNYQLQDNSPCINRGYNSYVENQVDLLGNLRIMNTTVDMGAYEWMGTVTMPVITPSDGAIFKGVAQKVTITCNTDDAIIYYTLDGSEPTRDSMIYTKAFNIKETTTIKAKAFAEQMWASKIATSKITKFVYSGNKELAEALDVPDWEVLTDTSKPWVKVGNVSSDNEDSAKCGGIGDSALSWMQTTVIGKGTLSFVWKTSCEDDPDFDDWDYVRFLVDDVEVVRKDGVDDWSVVEVRLDALKTHVLRWEYVKDSSGAEGEDCVWVDNVVWIKDPEPIPEIIKDSEVAVALEGSADAKLAANITDAAEYAAYRTWALGLEGVTPDAVKASPNAWLSYALDTDALIAAAPKEGDVVIDTFESAATDGEFEFTVKLDDIEVGENALGANLRKVFDIEGAETLANGGAGFSTDNVEVNTAAPESGNVKFTVTPKMEKDQMPDSFFFRVKMK